MEPGRWTIPLTLSIILGCLFAARRWRPDPQIITVIGVLTLSAAVGFGAAQFRANLVAAPVIAKRTGLVRIVGVVGVVEERQSGYRIVVENPVIERLAPSATPAKIRLTVRGRGGRAPDIEPGDQVEVTGVLMPPPQAALPGDFDFVRHAWFKRLGGVGYAISKPVVVGQRRADTLGRRIEALRQRISARVQSVLAGPKGAVAAALMTGKRGAIPGSVMQNMRDAGLAHLLAISGLHIGLLAGLLFFAVRAALALVEPLALNYAIKKWAALAALCGAFGYLLLSGATVPTQRAFLMTGLVLLAVMLDRQAFSMALVAWAAGAVLLLAPESLLGPSFQMSFAAVIALIAVYERLRFRLVGWRGEGGFPRRLMIYVLGVMLTTVIASLATAPFAAYHFGRLASYGLAANMIAVPLMATAIMPLAIAAFALMPFGLDSLALIPMGWAIDVMLAVAATVAAWPGAVQLTPAFSPSALALFALGALWLALWRTRWRLAGIAAMIGALGLALNQSAPDILADGAGKYFAVATPDGGLILSSTRKNHTTSAWLAGRGLGAGAKWPNEAAPANEFLSCDGLSCFYRAKGWTVALVRDAQALREDCLAADIVIATVPAPDKCCTPMIVIDRFDLWRRGAHAIWLARDGAARVVSVADVRGERLWSPRRPAIKAAAEKAP
jgi:competence protein ComEC